MTKAKVAQFRGRRKAAVPNAGTVAPNLQVDDLNYWWDYITSIQEIMDSLHILVEAGKVLYLGISDTPAWVVSAANTYARAHGKTPFSIHQGRWNTKKALEERKKKGEGLRSLIGPGQTEDEVKISEALSKVASEHGIESVTAIALAYFLSKTPNVFPIVGGRKVEHLQDNIQALKIKLTTKQIEYLDGIKPFDVGFPNNFIGEGSEVDGQGRRSGTDWA
ncbi:putative aryl-alcohol dehydrogenase protein [Lipomyces starkeyi]